MLVGSDAPAVRSSSGVGVRSLSKVAAWTRSRSIDGCACKTETYARTGSSINVLRRIILLPLTTEVLREMEARFTLVGFGGGVDPGKSALTEIVGPLHRQMPIHETSHSKTRVCLNSRLGLACDGPLHPTPKITAPGTNLTKFPGAARVGSYQTPPLALVAQGYVQPGAARSNHHAAPGECRLRAATPRGSGFRVAVRSPSMIEAVGPYGIFGRQQAPVKAVAESAATGWVLSR